MTNFIKDRNRFNLAPPPGWWLRALLEFDPSLAIIPSRVEALYRIGQRRQWDDRKIAGEVAAHPDTAMMTSYGLVPVTSIMSATGGWVWSPTVFQQLRARAGWRNGLTPTQAADAVDAADFQAKVDRKVALHERLDKQLDWCRTVAQWHTGDKVLVGQPSSFQESLARSAQRASSVPSSGRTAPSDARIA